jgi:hypothetical protein
MILTTYISPIEEGGVVGFGVAGSAQSWHSSCLFRGCSPIKSHQIMSRAESDLRKRLEWVRMSIYQCLVSDPYDYTRHVELTTHELHLEQQLDEIAQNSKRSHDGSGHETGSTEKSRPSPSDDPTQLSFY